MRAIFQGFVDAWTLRCRNSRWCIWWLFYLYSWVTVMFLAGLE